MKRGILPPVPIEFFGPEDFDTVNLWRAFFLAAEEERDSWQSLLDEQEKQLPFLASCIIGMAREKVIKEVWYPELCLPPVFRTALNAMKADGATLVPFKYPPVRNVEFLRKTIGEALRFIGMTEEEAQTRLQAWNPLRIALKRLDGVQTRSLALQSWLYVEALHGALDPSQPLPQLIRTAETKVAFNTRGFDKEPHLRVGILEVTPYQRGFYGVLDRLGAFVVFDEWGLENFPLGHSGDLASLYGQLAFPLGIKARRDRLEKEIKDRGIEAFIYGTFSAAEIRSNAVFLEKELRVPVFVYEIKKEEERSLLELQLLERFVRTLIQERSRGRKQ